MSKPTAKSVIRLEGVRQNNLKNFNLDLPLGQLVVITGVSGSGKSSLAFDTLFAEGQRRYTETFSPYARQFLDRMDKPQVDRIEGIPPAIAIEQHNSVRSTRSTVGTMTEICDYLKVLWSHLAQLHCRRCGRLVRKDSPQQVWHALLHPTSPDSTPGRECLVTFDLPLTEKLSLDESLALIAKQGYQRLLVPTAPPERASTAADSFTLNDALTPARNQPSTATTPFDTVRLEEAGTRFKTLKPAQLTVVQDRLRLEPRQRARFVEACEQAYHFGKGRLTVQLSPEAPLSDPKPLRFSNRLHCADCDLEYREPSPALFSFNHPVGACPTCRGFGRVITIDYNLAIPDRSRTLADGAIRPWQSGVSADCQRDLMKFCRIRHVPVDIPFAELSKAWQDWVIDGDPGYGSDKEHEWPRAWYGVKGYFRWLESKAYKMHVRVLLARYRSYTNCPDCQGDRLQPDSLLYRVAIPGFREPLVSVSREPASSPAQPAGLTLAAFYRLPVRDALRAIDTLANQGSATTTAGPLSFALNEVRTRLAYLVEVGLGYLTLDRPTRSLSGGETERVNLTTCLGTRLVNTLYVLDEPSVGLHPRDTERLVRVLQHLRDLGNTVVVVEHEASVMRAANHIVDLGPGHGEAGGELVFQGSFPDLLESERSLTGQYLGGRRRIEPTRRRPVTSPTPRRRAPRSEPGSGATNGESPWLRLGNATLHNLRNVAVDIPLGRLVCVTGVSGSGKSTLIREVLVPMLEARLKSSSPSPLPQEGNDDEPDSDSVPGLDDRALAILEGAEHLGRVMMVDQSPIGRTPRSNPAVYIGAFDPIRDLFAQSDLAKQRGLNSSAFSFNSAQGQCPRCRGAGFEKIEMQFLSDVFIRCPECNGRRYRPHILEIKLQFPGTSARANGRSGRRKTPAGQPGHRDGLWSIADILEATVDEVIAFLQPWSDSAHARNAARSLALLQEVGLGYLRLGQPINTLSGGESQRLKLVGHLAGIADPSPAPGNRVPAETATRASRPTLFLFDEPTTGLHFDDVRVLIQVFQRLVDAGNSVLVIEHNLDVIKCADWIIDLGPEAGDEGGRVVVCGTPEEVAACDASHTGRFLRPLLSTQ